VGTGAVNAYNNFTGNNILTNNNPERTKNNWSGAFDVGTTLMAAAPFASKSGRGALFGEQAWGRTAQTAGQVWGGAKNLPAQALNGVKNLSVSGIKNGATQALNGAKSWGTQGLGWAKNGATQAFNGAKGWGEKGLGGVKDWGAERLGGMKDWGTSAFRGAKDWGAERLQGVKDWGAQALSNSKGFGDRALNGAKTWGEQASGYTKNLGDRVVNGAKNFGPRASLFGQNMRIRASNFAAQARYQAQLAEYHFQLGVRSMSLGHDPQLATPNGSLPIGLEPPISPINKPLMSVNEKPQPMTMQGGNHDGLHGSGGTAGTSKRDTFTPENFPTPELILKSNNPVKQANMAGFAKKMSASANEFKAEFSSRLSEAKTPQAREKLMEEAYQWWVQKRYGMKPDEKLLNDIQPGDPNRDPFGKIAELKENGQSTPAYRKRDEIGQLINQRFRGNEGDVLDNPVTLPKWVADDLGLKSPEVQGNRLLRGQAADAIDQHRQQTKPPEKQYGYTTGAEKFMTETGDPGNQRILHDAGVKVLSRLMGDGSKLQDPKSMQQFSEAAYFLFQGPIKNRGSDSVIRGYVSSIGEQMSGKPVTLPHDVDIQAYARNQEDFSQWLAKSLKGIKSSSSEKVSSVNTQNQHIPQKDQKIETDITNEKVGYIFGHATGRQHNIDRAEQNIVQMKRLGLSDTPESHAYIRKHLESVPENPSNILRSFHNEHGNFEIRESLVSGPSGKFSLFESAWEVMPDGTRRLTSVIPKGGPKKGDK
jgi:hypothetical protein